MIPYFDVRTDVIKLGRKNLNIDLVNFLIIHNKLVKQGLHKIFCKFGNFCI